MLRKVREQALEVSSGRVFQAEGTANARAWVQVRVVCQRNTKKAQEGETG